MSALNGILPSFPNSLTNSLQRSESTASLPTPGKRKREPSIENISPNGVATDANKANSVDDIKLNQFLKDVLIVLESYDPTSLILNYALPLENVEEPETKRAKLSNAPTDPTIRTRINAEEYQSLAQLRFDTERVVLTVIESLTKDVNGHRHSSLSSEAQEKVSTALAFKEALIKLASREAVECSLKTEKGEEEHVLGQIPDHDAKIIDQQGRTVLTIYGNAPSARQLFSSLQRPTKVRPKDGSLLDSVEIYTPLRETGLPPQISVTKVLPGQPLDGEEKAAKPTFKDLFAPPSTLPQLTPPQPSKHTTTRSQSVNWYNPKDLDERLETPYIPKTGRSDKAFYWSQSHPTTQWLGYNVAPSTDQLSSPQVKRKQRDRALSIGDGKPAVSDEILTAQKQLKEDALFRSAYSSFAPTVDSTSALVSNQSKDALWWRKTGYGRFRNLFPPEVWVVDDISEHDQLPKHDIEEEMLFEEAVNSFSGGPQGISDAIPEKSIGLNDKDADDILNDISELLGQLHSYQRIRHASLSSNSLTSVGQNQQRDPLTYDPSMPSTAEFDIYDMLKLQLVTIISSLPPYAIAKLNGDQLSDLNISANVAHEIQNYRGTMEEDEWTARLKQTATGTSGVPRTSTASLNPRPSLSATSQYGHRTSYTNQNQTSRATTNTANYPSQYYGPRGSSNQQYSTPQFQRSTSATAYNSGYPQSGQTQYPQNGNAGYFQRAAQNGYTPGHNYSQPQLQASPYTQRPSQPGYQQRAQNSYQHALATATGRSASPMKQAAYTPQPTPSRQAGGYAPPTPTANMQSYVSNGSQSAQYSSYAAQTPTPVTAPGNSSGQYQVTTNQAVMIMHTKSQPGHGQTSGASQPPNGVYSTATPTQVSGIASENR